MKKPATPHNEKQRLQAVTDLCLTQSPSDPALNHISELAARLFNTPISLVTILDSERQFFKGAHGVSITETHRDISFCGHAIHSEQPLIVADTHLDERFVDNPLVTSAPHIRFYAGHPLKSPDGFLIGTLCVIDSTPRNFGASDLQTLADLAQIAENQIKYIADATTDDLTGLLNRRGFYALARKHLDLAMRSELQASLAVIDLIQFQEINDAFGHAFGDRVLRIFADALNQSTRKTDLVARLGGDKFVILSIDKHSDDLYKVRDRLQTAIAKLRPSDLPPVINIDFCIGALEFTPTVDIDLEAILANADQSKHNPKTHQSV